MQKKFDPKVFQLGYVALATPDLARAKDHYLETIGLTETDEARGEVYLSVGYEHHNIVLRGADKKSLAVSFTFLDEEKTPTDKDIDGMMNKIMNALETNLQAEIRK